MKKFTVDDIMELDPCAIYPRETVEALWSGSVSLTLREIYELDILSVDRAWALVGLLSLSDINMVVEWASECANSADRHVLTSPCAGSREVGAAASSMYYAGDALRNLAPLDIEYASDRAYCAAT